MRNDNYPAGTWEGDPRAPWNAPDPLEGVTCGDCRHLAEVAMLDGARAGVCASDVGDLFEVDPGRAACEGFDA